MQPFFYEYSVEGPKYQRPVSLVTAGSMSNYIIEFDEFELQLLKYLAECFDKRGERVVVDSIPGCDTEHEKRRFETALLRFERHQLLQWETNQSVILGPRVLQSYQQYQQQQKQSETAETKSRPYPLEITESLDRFQSENPEYRRNAFIMMQFGQTGAHEKISKAIKNTLENYGITAHRADDKEYHEDLFPNVLTYLHGCSFGIALFERLQSDDFNPNVSLEVGYMRALGRPICLLKDQTLTTLQSDLVGKLYRSFDPQDPTGSIPKVLESWMRDKDILI